MAIGIGGGAAATVTVAVAVVEPAELVATSEYVVVAVGETICDPLPATAAPFSVIVVAFEVDHESVDDWPLLMLVGFAFSMAVGIGGGGAVTVTVAVAVVEPAELVATSEYVAVAVGETVCDPLAATAAPFKVIVVAFEVDHESVDDWPLVMLVGFAFSMAVGIGGGGAVTVTVAVAVLEPAELVATSEYDAVAVGETICDPLAATAAPFSVI